MPVARKRILSSGISPVGSRVIFVIVNQPVILGTLRHS